MTNVIINDVAPYTQATATAGQTVYSTNWTANTESDVKVYSRIAGSTPNDTTNILSYPSAYSVAFIGGSETVQVTLVTPSTLGDIVTLVRDTPSDRLNLYTNTNFTPSMLNNDTGILTLVDQQAQLVNNQIAPRYNFSATINDGVDNILPVLPASSVWSKNAGNTAIEAVTLGTAASKNATNASYPYVASVQGSFTAGHLVVAADTLGTIVDFGAAPTSGTVTSVSSGTGLTGGPITSAGTLSFAAIPAHTFWANTSDSSAVPVATSLVTNPVTLIFAADSGSAGVTSNTITISGGSTGLTTVGSASTVSLTGTLNVTNGGTGLATTTANQLLYSSATNTIAGLASANNGTLITSAGGVPSISSTLPAAVQGNITEVGTIATGTWSGTAIAMNKGGTNANLTAANGAIPYSTASAFALLGATATAGLAFLSGSNAAPTWSTFPPITKISKTIVTASGTYTAPAGLKFAYVEVVGSGGGGGGAAGTGGQSGAGGGGGGGGYAASWLSDATIGASQTVTIGAAGAGATAGNNVGGNAAACSFGSLVIAGGGAGGSGSASSATTTQATGGGAGNGTTGNLLITGTAGFWGTVVSGVASAVVPGFGGQSALCFGGGGSSGGAGTGGAGTVYGGGGCGGFAAGSNAAGGAGALGACLVTEFISI